MTRGEPPSDERPKCANKQNTFKTARTKDISAIMKMNGISNDKGEVFIVSVTQHSLTFTNFVFKKELV